jgi:hypothetical protein
LGEVILFHDPSFIRCLRAWMKKNASGIAIAEGFDPSDLIAHQLN